MRIHRLISILLFIESKGIMKAKELASKLEISVRTVYRDIDTLCEAGIPFVTTSGPNGGIRLMEGYTGGISQLHEEDIINLYMGGMGIQPDRQSDMAIKLNTALLKIEKNLPQNRAIHRIKKRFYFDETPWWGEGQRLHHGDTLIHGVFHSKILKIEYKKFEGASSIRRIHPYGIVVKRMDWYLIGYCEKSNENRVFKCERIIASEMLDETFNSPEDFCVETYWNRSKQVFKDQCAEKEQYPVVIKLPKNSRDILESLEVDEMTEDEDDIVATVNMYGHQQAKDSIMKIIGCVEVMRPAEIREFVKKELTNIIIKYKG